MPYKVKDSGKRKDFKSGMRRDTDENKPRFDLIIALNIPYEKTMLYRWGMLMKNGMVKYGERNWEKANSQEELNRFKASAFRHFMQWFTRADDEEDHAAAVMFNINAAETTKEVLKNAIHTTRKKK